jgi:hypothetical protein
MPMVVCQEKNNPSLFDGATRPGPAEGAFRHWNTLHHAVATEKS